MFWHFRSGLEYVPELEYIMVVIESLPELTKILPETREVSRFTEISS